MRAADPAAQTPDPASVDLGWAHRSYDVLDPAGLPPDGRFRLLALGDSFMTRNAWYSDGEVDMRWPAILSRRSGGRLVERVLAAPGWGTDQQLLAFHQKGAPWEPDLVVLGVCTNNDLLNISSTKQNDAWKPYFVLRGGDLVGYGVDGEPLGYPAAAPSGLRLSAALRRSLGGRSALAALDPRYEQWDVNDRRTSIAIARLAPELPFAPQNVPDTVNAYTRETTEWTAYQWALMEALIDELDRQVQDVGARLVVLYLPMTLDAQQLECLAGSGLVHTFDTPEGPFTVDLEVPIERLRGICERLELEFWDPHETFYERATDPEFYEELFPLQIQRHWSWLGHEIVADVIGPRVWELVLQHEAGSGSAAPAADE